MRCHSAPPGIKIGNPAHLAPHSSFTAGNPTRGPASHHPASPKMNPVDQLETSPQDHEPAWFAIVREQVERLSFGTVQITVHNGRVTQVDATVRTRLESDGQNAPAAPGRIVRPKAARV